jgi:hypothetical protein
MPRVGAEGILRGPFDEHGVEVQRCDFHSVRFEYQNSTVCREDDTFDRDAGVVHQSRSGGTGSEQSSYGSRVGVYCARVQRVGGLSNLIRERSWSLQSNLVDVLLNVVAR